MKKINEIKQELLFSINKLIKISKEKLEKQEELENYEISVYERQKSKCLNLLENIDKVAIITIGREVNDLIFLIQEKCKDKIELESFKNAFDIFIEKLLFENKEYTTGLGITKEDLECLRGSNPIANDFGDTLRKKVNDVLYTKIPTAEELKKAYDCLDRSYKNDENMDEAYIKLKEMQENSGELKKGSQTYSLIENDKAYQEARKRIIGKEKENLDEYVSY